MSIEIAVGVQVVCLPDVEWDDFGSVPPEQLQGITFPIPGTIYTVRGIRTYSPSVFTGIGLYFEEIHNPALRDGREACFYSGCFRPVKKTDISQLTALLAPEDNFCNQ
jgi:hypothetical protein